MEDLKLLFQSLQTAIFDILGKDHMENKVLYNAFLLIFKLYIYCSREKGFWSITCLANQITMIKKTEEENTICSDKKRVKYENDTRQI